MAEKPNRLLAVISYLIPVIGSAVVFLVDRKNLFALYHACQAFALAMMVILLPMVWALISWVIAWVPLAGPTISAATFSIVMAGVLTFLILTVVGVSKALRTNMSALFLVGKWGERLFVRLYPEPVVESST